jgi:hypothetical protein
MVRPARGAPAESVNLPVTVIVLPLSNRRLGDADSSSRDGVAAGAGPGDGCGTGVGATVASEPQPASSTAHEKAPAIARFTFFTCASQEWGTWTPVVVGKPGAL